MAQKTPAHFKQKIPLVFTVKNSNNKETKRNFCLKRAEIFRTTCNHLPPDQSKKLITNSQDPKAQKTLLHVLLIEFRVAANSPCLKTLSPQIFLSLHTFSVLIQLRQDSISVGALNYEWCLAMKCDTC